MVVQNLDTRRYAAVKSSWIIETSREHFSISIFDRKHQASFYNVLVLHKLYKLYVTHGHDFKFKHYIPGRKKFLSFTTKISIWICWDVGVKIASDLKTSGLPDCLGNVAQIATKRLSVRWRIKVRHESVSHTTFVQFVQNQNIVKTRFAFLNKYPNTLAGFKLQFL